MGVIFALLVVGVLFGRVRSLPDTAPVTLEHVVLWVSLPALILVEVPRLAFGDGSWIPIAVAWGTLLVAAVTIVAAGRVMRWERTRVGTLLLVACLGNTSFLGLPAVKYLLGDEYLGPAIMYDQLGTFLGIATWGTMIAALYGNAERPSLGGLARRLVTFPPFVALGLALGISVSGQQAPVAAVIEPLGRPLAATLIPLVMLAIGMRLKLPRSRATLGPLGFGLAVCLLVQPIVAWGAMILLGSPSVEWKASVLEASMPPMVTASVLAVASGLEEELATALAGVGLLVALLSVPVWAWVLG